MNNQLIFQRRDEKSYWLLLRGLLNLKKIFIRFVFQEIFFREKSPKVHLTIIRECSKNTPHLDVKKF